MAITNKNGHGVTTSLPNNADAVSVGAISLPIQGVPANQSGGTSGPTVAHDTASSYPPKGAVSSPNSSSRGKQTSSKNGVYSGQ